MITKKDKNAISDKEKKTAIAVLAILLIAMVTYGVLDHKKQVENFEHVTTEKDNILNEKNEILTQLATLEVSYNEGLIKNTELSGDLEKKKNEIVKLKRSLKKFRGADAKTLSFFKNKIANLNSTSKKLLVMNDSLIRRNEVLSIENGDLLAKNNKLTMKLGSQEIVIARLTEQNKMLFNQNSELAREASGIQNDMSTASVVKTNLVKTSLVKKAGTAEKKAEKVISKFDPYERERLANNSSIKVAEKQKSAAKIKITALNERRGVFKQTDKAKITNVFEVSFSIQNKNIVKKGETVKLYVTIKDPNGNVLNTSNSFLDENNVKVLYSKAKTIKYKSTTLASNFDIVLDSKDKLKIGKYDIFIYLDKVLIRQMSKTLG